MKHLSKAIAAVLFFAATSASAQQTPPSLTTPPPTATTPPPSATTPPPAATTAPPPAPPAASVTIKPAAPPPPVQRRVTKPVAYAAAIAAGSLGTGIVFGILAAGKNASYKKTPDNQVALDGERNAFISDVAFGVAALFGLTAIALYMLPDEPSPSATTSTTTHGVAKFDVKTWVSSALKGEVLSF